MDFPMQMSWYPKDIVLGDLPYEWHVQPLYERTPQIGLICLVGWILGQF